MVKINFSITELLKLLFPSRKLATGQMYLGGAGGNHYQGKVMHVSLTELNSLRSSSVLKIAA